MRTSLCFTKMVLWNQKQNSVIPQIISFLTRSHKEEQIHVLDRDGACGLPEATRETLVLLSLTFFKKEV